MHLLLAIRAFFAVLFGHVLPIDFPLELLPPIAGTARKGDGEEGAAEPVVQAEPPKPAPVPVPVVETVVAPAPKGPSPDAVAVRAISIFQSEGRLFDFLFEEIDGYGDADIGAAVREIHRNCKRALQDHFKLARVRSEDEDTIITVPEGYDPAEIRVVGNVVGRPPFSGTLKHKGWRVEEVRLPHIPDGAGARVIAPAEVEV